MNTGSFYMLHDTGDKDVLAVADCVNLNFGTHEVFVDKHGVFNIGCKDDIHVFDNILVVECDNHILSAKYV